MATIITIIALIWGIITFGLIWWALGERSKVSYWMTRCAQADNDRYRVMQERNTALNKLSRTVTKVHLECICPADYPPEQGHRMDCPIVKDWLSN